jgi:[acyl-carrier-protein] S-malonyltransferase
LPGFTSALIFPAFASDYEDHPGSHLPGFDEVFQSFLREASHEFDPRLADFDFTANPLLSDELLTQYVTYLYSCAASRSLRGLGLAPSRVAGYSMGIYAALYDSGAVSLQGGLILIREAWKAVSVITAAGHYGMATIIGLSEEDILKIAATAGSQSSISNRNSGHAFVVSGPAAEIRHMLDLATEEGALHARALGTAIPFHAPLLKEAASRFADAIPSVAIADPLTPVVSLVDNRVLANAADIRDEVYRNIFTPLNWHATLLFLLENGVDLLVECGPSRGLVRNSKFIPGKFTFCDLASVTAYLPPSTVS